MKEYEIDFDTPFINWQLMLTLIICIGCIGVIAYPSLAKPDSKPVVVQEESKAIQIEYVTVLVTPTYDGINYLASEYEQGLRKLGRPFSWIREDTSGLKDTVVHARVYDVKEFNYYTWFNPTDYKYYKQYPSSLENKFVFVFLNIYMDDIAGQDTRMWLPNEQHYGIQINDMLYTPIDFVKQLRIQELEESYNYNDDKRVGYYGATNAYSASGENIKTAGETYIQELWLRGGKSNAVDGYIVFEVPKNTRLSEMTFNAHFYAFGDARWRLEK